MTNENNYNIYFLCPNHGIVGISTLQIFDPVEMNVQCPDCKESVKSTCFFKDDKKSKIKFQDKPFYIPVDISKYLKTN